MHVQPYLFFHGQCDEAIAFYQQALGAQLNALMRYEEAPGPLQVPDGWCEKVMHASLQIGQTEVLMSDGRGEHEAPFNGFSLHLALHSVVAAEKAFAALAEEGRVDMPLEKTFWAQRFGMLHDRFGVGWMISCR
ncbi:glyoxalase/bleomycin resistance/extradiol dioxygenase family protein [Pseudomonas sp. R3.Fl]|uniref:VOC family protein n=1 Tax=Pseudomonas TaxID=286 RepID=UPI000E2F6462|nr:MULTISPECIES: glyoxalase/bleomycin resistance/extradiol dioxygenase family protein [Pseudomonas]MCL6691240.1 glyoxalase/bleomycin resistance/extradiol dioxygenase family protein [Pseudomonas sp. R3.Fl]GBL59636.1 bleomycin resistance protein [Pseudomonas citronellolis]